MPYISPDPDNPGFYDFTDPQNLTASPNGWHQEFDTTTDQTE
jgi:hypothetical protein